MSIIYREELGNLAFLDGKTVGVIGYGKLGRPFALNLRDSGIHVRVGIHSSDSESRALADGFRTASIAEIAREAHILLLLLPDEVMPQVYLQHISPHMARDKTLVFASGYNVTYGFIEAPPFVDVVMLAPRTLGSAVRERYLTGQGFYSFVGVGQDASGHALNILLALAKAVGSLRAGAIEITMEQETELDLFIQQGVLPIFHRMMTTAAEVLLREGYPPEAAMMELYISGEFTDYLKSAMQSGLLQTLRQSPLAAQYGLLSRLDRFNELKLERLMENALDDVRNGNFAGEWAREYTDGMPRLKKLLKQQESLDLWELEQQTIESLEEDL